MFIVESDDTDFADQVNMFIAASFVIVIIPAHWSRGVNVKTAEDA